MKDQEFEMAAEILKVAFLMLSQNCDTVDESMVILAAELLLKRAECLIEMVGCFFLHKYLANVGMDTISHKRANNCDSSWQVIGPENKAKQRKKIF